MNQTPKKTDSPGGSALKMGVFTLAMINVSAIVSLRGLPAESTYGLSSAFYYIFAAIFFLIPVSLVEAELTTGWPQKGGVFRWVGEAFDKYGYAPVFRWTAATAVVSTLFVLLEWWRVSRATQEAPPVPAAGA